MTASTSDRVVRRRAVAIAVAFAGLASLGGCAAEDVLPAPRCEDGGSAMLTAQSVPTAGQIPCLGRLPEGWEVDSVTIDQDGTTVVIDSDRAGRGAAVLRLRESCDVSASVRAPSDLPVALRFDTIEQLVPSFRAERFYLFAGGCVSWSFDFDEGASAAETVEIGEALDLYSRVKLNELIHETFIDRDV
jgi:hypothetical protein